MSGPLLPEGSRPSDRRCTGRGRRPALSGRWLGPTGIRRALAQHADRRVIASVPHIAPPGRCVEVLTLLTATGSMARSVSSYVMSMLIGDEIIALTSRGSGTEPSWIGATIG
jgi:hypothetical protein